MTIPKTWVENILWEFQHGNSHILGVTNAQFYCIRYNLPIDLDFITLL